MSAADIKVLRERTGAGILDCKAALSEANGDLDAAVDVLRKKGAAKAAKKSGRETAEGLIESYIHGGGRVGVLVEVNCETDFVARNEDFQKFVSDIAMHIAAAKPLAVSEDDLDPAVLAKEKEIYEEQIRSEGKPEDIIPKIVEGKLKKFKKEVALLDQEYVKNPDLTVGELLTETIAKIGENIKIRRFARFERGE
jgi:elongation factor Ts